MREGTPPRTAGFGQRDGSEAVKSLVSEKRLDGSANTSASEARAFPVGYLHRPRRPTRTWYPSMWSANTSAYPAPSLGDCGPFHAGVMLLHLYIPGIQHNARLRALRDVSRVDNPSPRYASFSTGSSSTNFLCDGGQVSLRLVSSASTISCVTLGRSLPLSVGPFPPAGWRILSTSMCTHAQPCLTLRLHGL